MADLLAESDSDDNSGFKINKSYADNYEKWRGKEELQKFTDRYGEAALAKLDDSDNESSSTDEDIQDFTPQMEKQFFKVLSCLKKKDPKIYDANINFFEKKEPEDEQKDVTNIKKKLKKENPMFLRDYERKIILERGGQVDSDDELEAVAQRSQSPTFVQEEKEIKQSFKAALAEDSDSDDQKGGIGGLFQPRQKSKEEQEKEEETYREWLKGQKEELGNKEDATDLDTLKNYWSNPKLDDSEVYLRDYILNKRYLDEDDPNYIPTYDEVIHDSDEGGLSADEEMVKKAEQFEHKYNFRFEEPDQQFMKSYPRNMQTSLRHDDDRRKKHRQEVKDRKEKEKEAKRQQLLQLKAIKRKEIAERLEKLKQLTGNTNIEFQDQDLNDDFDPEKHDQRMQKLFNSDFYQEADEEKPEFPDLDEELEIENWDQYKVEDEVGESSGYEPHCEDPDFNMDCDYDPRASLQQEMIASQQSRKKNRRRSKLAEVLSKKKPKFDPTEQQSDKYLDEYYGLEYEDIIGDLPCRFKYRKVVPNSFGLTVEEILMADDKELNRWCSLKKTCQYRPEGKELYDVQAYEKKAQFEALKRKILPSLYKQDKEEASNPGEMPTTSKKKKKKKKNAGSSQDAETNQQIVPAESEGLENGMKKNKKKKRSADEMLADSSGEVSESVKKKKKTNIAQEESCGSSKGNVKLMEDHKNKTTKPNHTDTQGTNKGKVSQAEERPPDVVNGKSKKKRKKRKSETLKPQSQEGSTNKLSGESNITNAKSKKKHKKLKMRGTEDQRGNKASGKSHNNQPNPSIEISDSRLKAYGINPKKFKNKLKYGKK